MAQRMSATTGQPTAPVAARWVIFLPAPYVNMDGRVHFIRVIPPIPGRQSLFSNNRVHRVL